MKTMGLLIVMLAACGGSKQASTLGNQGNAVTLEWKATQADGENVDVTLMVAGQEIAVGPLNAASDEAPGTPATCKLGTNTTTQSELVCGLTPAYNFYVAELVGNELVITHVHGVETGEPADHREERKEVKRVPVKGSSLVTAPYAVPAANPQ